MFGLVVVCFCLFLWMFLLGIWAGQTILLPPRTIKAPVAEESGPQALPETGGEDSRSQRQQRTTHP
jgi:hypothetical protein